jgi:predicted secreted protein
MKLTSILAIYFLFWIMSAFLVMPFGIRSHDDDGAELVPGQASSAPVNFNAKRVAQRATVLSLVLFGLYYLNFVNGWITVDDINITNYF